MIDWWERLFAAQLGDETAAGDLFREFSLRLVAFFLTRGVGSQQDQEDLAQEVFLQLFRGEWAAEARFETFLFGVARNVLWNHRRKPGARVTVGLNDVEVADLFPSPVDEPGCASDLARAQSQKDRDLWEFVAECRAAGISHTQAYSEWARMTETTPEAVRGRWQRLRGSLRGRLEGEEEDE